MSRFHTMVIGFGLGLALGFFLGILFATNIDNAIASINPPDAAQQNADIYQCCNFPGVFSGWTQGDLSTYNPITTKLRAGSRSITWHWVEACSSGNMKDTFEQALADTSKTTGLKFTEVSSGQDVTIRATCGNDFVTRCGQGPIACLYPSWPYQSNINASTVMATFYDLSQVSIWEHEFAGHALGTWNEQYQLDGAFSPTPNLVDFMNTGINSRYSWPQDDIDRWSRTVYDLTPKVVDPVWDVCDPNWNGWHNILGFWTHGGTWIWMDALGRGSSAPEVC